MWVITRMKRRGREERSKGVIYGWKMIVLGRYGDRGNRAGWGVDD